MLVVMRRMIVWLLFYFYLFGAQVPPIEAEAPPIPRRLPLPAPRLIHTRRQIARSASQPIVIKINTPGSRPTGRRIPNLTHPLPESSILRLKPVIRFHVPTVRNETPSDASQELHETLSRMGLHRMASLLRDTALDGELLGLGPITVFAPTDDAFSLTPADLLQSLKTESDGARIKEFLLNHVIRGHMYPGDVRNDFTMPTIHPSAVALRFNIYDGGQVVTVSGAQFVGSWVPVRNILIQPVDRILFPLSQANIVRRISEEFPEMYQLVRKSGLADQLLSGTFTVFAPTDEAFIVLPPRARQILQSNSTLLRRFLLNHIVPGTYFSPSLNNGFQLKPLGGELLDFATRRGLILVNGIPVIKPDLPVNNGVIHSINRVLVPQELVDMCRCISKYPLAPATLKPTAWNSDETQDGDQSQESDKDFTEGEPQEDSINRPQLVRLFSRSIRLPDGRVITFNTADQLFRKSPLFNRLRQPARGGFTILLPSDRAFQRLPPSVMERLQQDPRRLAQVLRWHVLQGTVNPNTLTNNLRLKTLAGGTLLVTVPQGTGAKQFPPTFLIGGVPILAIRRASNGAVFAVDRVFDPPPQDQDIADGMGATPDAPTNRLSIWRKIIDDLPDLKTQLKSKVDVYTMFAPVDEAFAELSSDQLQRLLNEEALKRAIVKSHVLSGSYFRSMFSPDLVLPTLLGNKLRLSSIPDGFLVNDVTVKTPGILTGNGVVYVVNKLLLTPDSVYSRSLSSPFQEEGIDAPFQEPFGRSVQEIARQYRATTFLKWVHAAGLRNAIRVAPRCTLFLPTDAAIATLSPTVRIATLGNRRTLKKLVQYHICPNRINSFDDLSHQDRLLPTFLPKKTIRCNVYRNKTVVTASGCPVSAVVEPADEEMRIAVVDKVLTPPVGNLFLTMSKSPLLRNFTKIVRVSGVNKLLESDDSFTLFAPIKCVFERMPPEEYEKLITDKEAARIFVERHLVRGCIYLKGISDGMTLTSISGNKLHFKLKDSDCIYVNDVKLKYGDMNAVNGVIHILSNTL